MPLPTSTHLLARDNVLGNGRRVGTAGADELLRVHENRARRIQAAREIAICEPEPTHVFPLPRSEAANNQNHRDTTLMAMTSAATMHSSATWRKKPAKSPLMPPNCVFANG